MELPSAYRLPELTQKLAGRGMGWWEALQLLIHHYKEVAVLFNWASLKKHAVFAFFRGSKDTIVDLSLAPQRRSS